MRNLGKIRKTSVVLNYYGNQPTTQISKVGNIVRHFLFFTCLRQLDYDSVWKKSNFLIFMMGNFRVTLYQTFGFSIFVFCLIKSKQSGPEFSKNNEKTRVLFCSVWTLFGTRNLNYVKSVIYLRVKLSSDVYEIVCHSL